MAAYRRGLDQHPETLSRLVRQFNKQGVFTLSGPEYARSKGETTALLQPWYNRKSINLQHDGPLDERIFSPELAQDVIDGFRALMPLYRYFDKLCASVAESYQSAVLTNRQRYDIVTLFEGVIPHRAGGARHTVIPAHGARCVLKE